jgi:hypothetical protein
MPRKKQLPPPPDVNVPEEQRESLSMWLKECMAVQAEGYEERIASLKEVGEHPSPLMGRFVRTFAGLGMPTKFIASLCKTSVSTIEKYYEEEMLLGRSETVAMVATNAVRIATSQTDPAASKMALAFLDRLGGDDWKPPTKRVEMGEIEKPRVLDTSKLTYEQRAQLREIMLSMAGQAPAAELTQDEDTAE